jgi:hypothetical protein
MGAQESLRKSAGLLKTFRARNGSLDPPSLTPRDKTVAELNNLGP